MRMTYIPHPHILCQIRALARRRGKLKKNSMTKNAVSRIDKSKRTPSIIEKASFPPEMVENVSLYLK